MGTHHSLFEQPDSGPPRMVVIAISLLALLFLSGAVYLLISGPFARIEVMEARELSESTVAVMEYEGALPGIEKARRQVARELEQRGLSGGQPFTIFYTSPFKMRPIAVKCQVGYMLPLGYNIGGLSEPVQMVKIKPGRRVIVRVRGKGNFTGSKAYRAAEKQLSKHGLRPGSGKRFELKIRQDNKKNVEHWIPVQ
jgi:DNA gyrase inhibitor GyrI